MVVKSAGAPQRVQTIERSFDREKLIEEGKEFKTDREGNIVEVTDKQGKKQFATTVIVKEDGKTISRENFGRRIPEGETVISTEGGRLLTARAGDVAGRNIKVVSVKEKSTGRTIETRIEPSDTGGVITSGDTRIPISKGVAEAVTPEVQRELKELTPVGQVFTEKQLQEKRFGEFENLSKQDVIRALRKEGFTESGARDEFDRLLRQGFLTGEAQPGILSRPDSVRIINRESQTIRNIETGGGLIGKTRAGARLTTGVQTGVQITTDVATFGIEGAGQVGKGIAFVQEKALLPSGEGIRATGSPQPIFRTEQLKATAESLEKAVESVQPKGVGSVIKEEATAIETAFIVSTLLTPKLKPSVKIEPVGKAKVVSEPVFTGEVKGVKVTQTGAKPTTKSIFFKETTRPQVVEQKVRFTNPFTKKTETSVVRVTRQFKIAGTPERPVIKITETIKDPQFDIKRGTFRLSTQKPTTKVFIGESKPLTLGRLKASGIEFRPTAEITTDVSKSRRAIRTSKQPIKRQAVQISGEIPREARITEIFEARELSSSSGFGRFRKVGRQPVETTVTFPSSTEIIQVPGGQERILQTVGRDIVTPKGQIATQFTEFSQTQQSVIQSGELRSITLRASDIKAIGIEKGRITLLEGAKPTRARTQFISDITQIQLGQDTRVKPGRAGTDLSFLKTPEVPKAPSKLKVDLKVPKLPKTPSGAPSSPLGSQIQIPKQAPGGFDFLDVTVVPPGVDIGGQIGLQIPKQLSGQVPGLILGQAGAKQISQTLIPREDLLNIQALETQELQIEKQQSRQFETSFQGLTPQFIKTEIPVEPITQPDLAFNIPSATALPPLLAGFGLQTPSKRRKNGKARQRIIEFDLSKLIIS